jgi:hypothetical protein
MSEEREKISKKEKEVGDIIIVKKGDMINRGPHEDDDYFIANVDLKAIIVEIIPGAYKVNIPKLTEERLNKWGGNRDPEIFYIHKPN